MRRTAQYFGKKMVNLYTNNVLDWENKRLFVDNPLAKIAPRPNRLYYQYSDWSDISNTFDRGHVLSAFTYVNGSDEKLMIAYGLHRRLGLVSLAPVTRTDQLEGTSSMGLAYVSCELGTEESCEDDILLEKVDENITSHCLLLPYLLPGTYFKTKLPSFSTTGM